MDKRRILILTNRVPYPLNDGGNLAMKAMIDGYKNAGWDVCLLSMNTSRHYISKKVLKEIYNDIRFITVAVNNDVQPVQVLTNYLFSSLPNHAARFRSKAFTDKLSELLVSFSPQVVQFESIFLSGYVPLIKQESEAMTVLRMHNIEWQVWERFARETSNPVKKIYLNNLAQRVRRYEEGAWPEYDLLLPITEVDKAAAAGYNEHMLVVPFGIESAEGPVLPINPPWRPYHIGAMDWLPNAEAVSWFLKDIWPAIHQLYPNMRFHFAGRKMPDSFRSIKIDGAICAGEVPDANEFIRDKNILIVPLRSAGGIRVKILEAMAAGKLVVSTAVGMQGIGARAGQDFLLADDEDGFIRAMKFVNEYPEKAAAIAQNGAELVNDRYGSEPIMAGLMRKIDNMLACK